MLWFELSHDNKNGTIVFDLTKARAVDCYGLARIIDRCPIQQEMNLSKYKAVLNS